MSLAPPLPTRPAARAPQVRRQLLRGALFVALLCVTIATLLTASGNDGFGVNLAHSLAIGGCCWLFIDGGRHALAAWRERTRNARGLAPDLPPGFPGWPPLIVLVVLGMVLGPVAGTALIELFDDGMRHNLWSLQSTGSRITWGLTLLASIASVVTLTLLERLSHARADAEAARRAAAENQLKLLEAQLEPHMLFNTLANLRVLIGSDPPRAQAMLDRLIAFLRATLEASRRGSHSLADEFARLHDYLALMQVRMGPRLRFELQLPEALRGWAVPPLLLQPLVENSIRHGLEPKVPGGFIVVSASRDDQGLRLCVRDSGDGPGAGAGGGGFGLQQVRERLRTLYGERAGLQLTRDDDDCTLAIVRLPTPA